MNKRGESLTETIIALSILSIGITISSIVIANALRNMSASKDRVIAVNIAREGLEAMRNLRDTNWLKFSDDRRLCWNHFPGDTSVSDTCDGSTPIEPGQYILYKNNEFRWKLDATTQGVDDATPLSEVDIDALFDTNKDDDFINDPDIYNHVLTTDNDALNFGSQITPFKRVITIEYLENEPDATSSPSNDSPPDDTINNAAEWAALGAAGQTAANRILITSTVTWEETNRRGTVVHNVDLQTILTDYLGRDNLES